MEKKIKFTIFGIFLAILCVGFFSNENITPDLKNEVGEFIEYKAFSKENYFGKKDKEQDKEKIKKEKEDKKELKKQEREQKKKLEEDKHKEDIKDFECIIDEDKLKILSATKWECFLDGECETNVVILYKGENINTNITKQDYEIENYNTEEIEKELNDLLIKGQTGKCEIEKEKLKKNYKYEIDIE